MMKKIFATALLFSFSVASANHELIVKPVDHGHESEQGHGRHDHGDDRKSDRAYRHSGLYLTPYMAIGVGSGGDVIGSFTDNFGEVERLRSGGGVFIEGGLLLAVDDYTRLRLTGGYEVDGVSRENGDSSFDRVRFDAMLLRNFGSQEFGIGLTAHTGVEYSCQINPVCAGRVDFDSAVGFTAEYALTTARSAFGGSYDRRRNPLRDARLGLRYTDIEYRPQFTSISDQGTGVVDGSSLSLFLGFAW